VTSEERRSCQVPAACAQTPRATATEAAVFMPSQTDQTAVADHANVLAHCEQAVGAFELSRKAAGQRTGKPAGESAAGVAAEPSPLCFEFLNRGRCTRAVCTFRHVRPDEPEALSDRRKRAVIGWQPNRVQQQLEARAARAQHSEAHLEAHAAGTGSCSAGNHMSHLASRPRRHVPTASTVSERTQSKSSAPWT